MKRAVNSSITVGNDNNDNLGLPGSTSTDNRQQTADSAFIKILDIFGFESFKSNYFEQLCINYTYTYCNTSSNSNKRSMRRKEESPGRSYRFLDIIEKKHSSIFSILDEQCTVLNTIIGWLNARINFLPLRQTKNAVKTLGMIDSNRTQRARGLFSIQHYAGVVEDDSKSFLDKNNDELPKEATDFLLPSSAAIFVELGKILSGKNDAGEIKDGRLAHLCMY